MNIKYFNKKMNDAAASSGVSKRKVSETLTR